MTINATQNLPLTLSVTYTLKGNPGSVDPNTPIVWGLSPPGNGTIKAIGDGKTAEATMTVLGQTQVTVTADADLSGGETILVGTETIMTTAAVVIGADLATVEALK